MSIIELRNIYLYINILINIYKYIVLKSFDSWFIYIYNSDSQYLKS